MRSSSDTLICVIIFEIDAERSVKGKRDDGSSGCDVEVRDGNNCSGQISCFCAVGYSKLVQRVITGDLILVKRRLQENLSPSAMGYRWIYLCKKESIESCPVETPLTSDRHPIDLSSIIIVPEKCHLI